MSPPCKGKRITQSGLPESAHSQQCTRVDQLYELSLWLFQRTQPTGNESECADFHGPWAGGEKYCQEERNESRHQSWVALGQELWRGSGIEREVPKGRAAEVPTGVPREGEVGIAKRRTVSGEETAHGTPNCFFTICKPLSPQDATELPQSPRAHSNGMCSWTTHVTS